MDQGKKYILGDLFTLLKYSNENNLTDFIKIDELLSEIKKQITK